MKGIGVGLAVDQQQIRADMAFAVGDPVAGKHMVPIGGRQRVIGGKGVHDRLQQPRGILVAGIRHNTAKVALEG